MKRLAFVALLVLPAVDRVEWHGRTWATIGATTAPGGVAEVLFHNEDVNGDSNNGSSLLTFGDIDVTVVFTWNAEGSADQIVLEPPEGYVAVPRVLTVPEGGEGLAVIYPLQSVGM